MPIITFNPLRERGLERFTNPQSPIQMLTLSETQISTQYHQLNPAAISAALVGMSKALLAMDDEAKASGSERAIDVDFIAQDTARLREFRRDHAAVPMARHRSVLGLDAADDRGRDTVYRNSNATIACYGMGLTQHRSGVLAIQMLSNLLLLRGNIGKPGAGIFPVRGHSNVQGQRTVGITEKPELVPLDRLAEQFGFDPPRKRGLNTVEACEACATAASRRSSASAAISSAPFPRRTSWSARGGTCS